MSAEARLSPHVGVCHNYVDSGGGEKKVSVVVAPIGV